MEEYVNRIAADRGLRHRLRRVARRAADQHRSIEECYRALGEAIGERTKSDVRAAFGRYRHAITAHFDLEEQVFFPAVRGADTSQNAPIRELVAAHSRLVVELAHMADSIESLTSDDFSRRLVGFATMLASHEHREDALLTQTIDADPGCTQRSAVRD